jgi:hypothetical protein
MSRMFAKGNRLAALPNRHSGIFCDRKKEPIPFVVRAAQKCDTQKERDKRGRRGADRDAIGVARGNALDPACAVLLEFLLARVAVR